MPKLPDPRPGEPLRIKQRPLEFSFWPMAKTTRRYGLGFRVFAANPWPLIARSIEQRCPAAARPAAHAFRRQAQDYYTAAAAAAVTGAKPILLYYCLLNLVKAYVLSRGQRSQLDLAIHGLSENIRPPGRELTDAYLCAYRSSASNINVFDEFLRAARGKGLRMDTQHDLAQLLPQVVAGHRLWAMAAGRRERFVSVERISFLHDRASKRMWLRCDLRADDLRRLGVSHARVIREADLATEWRDVKCPEQHMDHQLVRLEQRRPIQYTHRPSDKVQDLVDAIRRKLWATVRIAPPYRRYYLYLAPPADRSAVLPQLLSIYAVMYYLGSITRYRPHHFAGIMTGPMGPMIEAFLNDQPTQFLYLMASDIAEQEVTKAAIV